MSQERIDIIITDGIDSGVAQKIAMIGKAATMANGDLKILQNTLNSLGVNKLQDLTRAIGNFNIAQAKMQTVQEKGRLLQAKTTTEYSRNAALMSRIANGQAISIQRVATEHERGSVQAARAVTEQAKLGGVMSRNEISANRAAMSSAKLAQSQENASHSVKRHTTSWIGHIAQVAGGIIVYQAIRSTLAAFVMGVQKAVAAVDAYNVSVIQMAGVLTSLAADKTDISAVWRQALGYSQGLVQTLEKVDANTTLNLENLQMISLEMAKQGVTLDTNNAKEVEGFTAIANAVALFSRNGQDARQVMQETRAMFSGQIRDSDQLGKLLNTIVQGDLKTMVNQWKVQGTSIQEIGKRLDGFVLASRALSGTWGAVTSSMSTTFNILSREVFTDILHDWTKKLHELNDYLREHKVEIGKTIHDGYKKLESAIKWCWNNATLLKNVLLAMFAVSVIKRVVELTTAVRTLGAAMIVARNAALGLEIALGSGGLIAILGAAGLPLIGFTALFAGLAYAIWKAVEALDDYGKKQLAANYNPLKDNSKKVVVDGKTFTSVTGPSGRSSMVQSHINQIKSGDYSNVTKLQKAESATDAPILAKLDPESEKAKKEAQKILEKRVTLLQKWNMEADKEIRTATMLNDERDIQNKLDEHNIRLTTKKMNTLNPAEKKQLEDKLRLAQSETEIGKIMNKIYDDVQGPMKEYSSTQEALNRLLAEGTLSQSQYNEQLNKAQEVYVNAVDPLKEMVQSLNDEHALIGLVGNELELATFRQQVENKLKAEGKNLTDESTRARIDALVKMKEENMILAQTPNLYNELKTGIKSWGDTMSSTLNDMLWGSKTTFDEIMNSFLKMITEMIIRTQVMAPLMSGLGLSGFSNGGVPGSSTSITPAAKGFVTDIPTIFPMAKGGIGIMSEFGQDEAVMPLTRVNGQLGVKAVGGGSGPQNVQVSIVNEANEKLEVKSSSFDYDAESMILQVVLNGITKDKMGLRSAIGR